MKIYFDLCLYKALHLWEQIDFYFFRIPPDGNAPSPSVWKTDLLTCTT